MKKIQLGLKGKNFAIVDNDDYANLVKYKWWYSARGYAAANINGTRVYMHRYINNTAQGLDTDHINGDKLDNRKSNLRSVSRSLNNHNSLPASNNTSGYKGVNWFKPAKLWRAYIKVRAISEKRIELGYFKTKEQAIKARKNAELNYGVKV